jgi:hypothetical protein
LHALPKASYFAKAYSALHTKRAFVSNDQMKSCPTNGISYTSLSNDKIKSYLMHQRLILQVTASIKTSTNIALPNQKQAASPKARDHTGHDHKNVKPVNAFMLH